MIKINLKLSYHGDYIHGLILVVAFQQTAGSISAQKRSSLVIMTLIH